MTTFRIYLKKGQLKGNSGSSRSEPFKVSRVVLQIGDAEHWITVHPNGKGNGKGSPVLLNGAGQVIGGMGGKNKGQVWKPNSKSEARPGTGKQHAPAIWLGPANASPEIRKNPEPAPHNPEAEAKAKRWKNYHGAAARADELSENANRSGDFLHHLEAAKAHRIAKQHAMEIRMDENLSPEEHEEGLRAWQHHLFSAGEHDEIAIKKGGSAYHKLSAEESAANAKKKSQEAFSGEQTAEKHQLAHMAHVHAAYELEKYRRALRDEGKLTQEERQSIEEKKQEHSDELIKHKKALTKIESKLKAAATREKNKQAASASEGGDRLSIEKRFSQHTPAQVQEYFHKNYGLHFHNDETVSAQRELAKNKKIKYWNLPPEQQKEFIKRQDDLRNVLTNNPFNYRIKGHTAADINLKNDAGAKAVRKHLGYIDESFKLAKGLGYDIPKALAKGKVHFAAGSTGKNGGHAWQDRYGRGGVFSLSAKSDLWGEKYHGYSLDYKKRTGNEWNAGWHQENEAHRRMSTIIHEIAHALGMQSHINSPSRLHGIMSDPKHHHIFGSSHEERQKWIGKNISDYAKSNKLETDAELAAKVISPGYVKGTLPKVLEDHVKWLFEGKD